LNIIDNTLLRIYSGIISSFGNSLETRGNISMI
jgi:hypothetical protein